jgi:hypothetical protein
MAAEAAGEVDWLDKLLGPTALSALAQLAALIRERPLDVVWTLLLVLVPLLALSVVFSLLLIRELDKADGKDRGTAAGAARRGPTASPGLPPLPRV